MNSKKEYKEYARKIKQISTILKNYSKAQYSLNGKLEIIRRRLIKTEKDVIELGNRLKNKWKKIKPKSILNEKIISLKIKNIKIKTTLIRNRIRENRRYLLKVKTGIDKYCLEKKNKYSLKFRKINVKFNKKFPGFFNMAINLNNI